MLNHLGGFLLLTAIAVHFTGEPGMSCPCRRSISLFLLAIHPRPKRQSFSRNLDKNSGFLWL